MRICLYTESALPLVGGQEIVVDQLAREFLNLGHEVVVLAARHRGRLEIRDHELPYRVVRHPRFISTHRFVGWYQRYLTRLRRQFPFDVLNCHSVQPTGYVAACCRSLKGVPVVITSHCGEICPESQLLLKSGASHRCTTALQRADAVIAISEFAEQCLRTIYPKLSRIERIRNGVRCSEFLSPAGRSTRFACTLRPSRYFLFLGRLVQRKGVDLLLQAFRQASASADIQCVIAGDGVELEALDLLATQLGLTTRMHFVGHVEGENKVWLLQNAIATVMPSRVWEGCPLVALESFAAGRPVIATRTAGLQELVQPNRTGFLVAPESVNCLANALVDAVADAAATNRLGECARDFAKQYDWALVARRYCDVFEGLLSKKPNSYDRHRAA